MTIGGATNIPDFGLLSDAPIIISDRRANVVKSHNFLPLINPFRVNICVGYLDQNDNFLPSLRADSAQVHTKTLHPFPIK